MGGARVEAPATARAAVVAFPNPRREPGTGGRTGRARAPLANQRIGWLAADGLASRREEAVLAKVLASDGRGGGCVVRSQEAGKCARMVGAKQPHKGFAA